MDLKFNLDELVVLAQVKGLKYLKLKISKIT